MLTSSSSVLTVWIQDLVWICFDWRYCVRINLTIYRSPLGPTASPLSGDPTPTLSETLPPHGTQLHNEQGALFSQSATLATELVFTVALKTSKKYRKRRHESYPLSTLTGAARGSKQWVTQSFVTSSGLGRVPVAGTYAISSWLTASFLSHLDWAVTDISAALVLLVINFNVAQDIFLALQIFSHHISI